MEDVDEVLTPAQQKQSRKRARKLLKASLDAEQRRELKRKG